MPQGQGRIWSSLDAAFSAYALKPDGINYRWKIITTDY